MAPSIRARRRSCPPQHPLRLGRGRRHFPHHCWSRPAAMGTPGVLIVPLEKEFGWDNAQISSALALRLMLFGLFGPFAAAFMNRFGVRRVMMCAVVLIAGGLLASLAMTQVWQLILLWGIVVGIGTGLTAMVLAATVATRWFNAPPRPRHRHSGGEQCHRPARVSAADRRTHRPASAGALALVFVCRHAGASSRLSRRY